MIDIYVFLLCHNEEILIPHTIRHYKKHIPNCQIIIYDNQSTDRSCEIAQHMGCKIVSWNSNNEMNEGLLKNIKNNCWKYIRRGGVIVADMDEWLCITQEELINEYNSGTTVLSVEGYNIIGNSKAVDLSDIDLHSIKKAVHWKWESKNMCFFRPHIIDMNYSGGAHRCNPRGKVKYSDKLYKNKHMEFLGLPFIIDKMKKRYDRNERMRKENTNTHYITDIDKITENYNRFLDAAVDLS